MSSAIDSLTIGLERLLAGARCAARVLRSPFWTRPAHVVLLRPVRIEQRDREPAPFASRRVQDPPRSRARGQHTRHIRVYQCTHFGCPWVAASIAVLPSCKNNSSVEPAAQFCPGGVRLTSWLRATNT